MQQESLSVNITEKEANNKEKEAVTTSIVSYLEDFGLTEKEAKDLLYLI